MKHSRQDNTSQRKEEKESYITPELVAQEPLPDITAMPIMDISVTLEDVPDPREDMVVI